MWAFIARWAVKLALYAVQHPEIVQGIISDVAAAKAAKQQGQGK